MKRFGWKMALGILGISQVVFAQEGNPVPPPTRTSGGNSITLINPLACDNFVCIGEKIALLLFNIAVPLTVIMVLIGGFQILTAGGDPEKFKTGRKTLIYAAAGFAIVLISGGVAQLIQNLLKAANP